MKRLRHAITGLAVALYAALLSIGYGQQIGSPAGIKSEQSLPSRHPYVVEDMLKFCRPMKGFWIDLGAGQGQIAIPLIEKTGNPVTMLDPDDEAMREGLEAVREKGLEDKLFAVVGVAENLPFPDDSVDLVVSRGSIFFWDEPAKGLQEVYRVLRPGCRAYIGGGAGAGYPEDAVKRLIEQRRKKMEGDEAEKWKEFVELRRPEQMQQWADQAGLPEFEIMGRGAISYDDERVGQGVWLLFEKKPEMETRKEEDVITARLDEDTIVYSITSPSGIGGATVSPRKGWQKKIVLRLRLRGLESLKVSNGTAELHGSVLSHSGNPRLLSVKQENRERKVDSGDPYWTTIKTLDGEGKPVQGLPDEKGYFEIELPPVLFDSKPKSITIEWIDFYR